MDLDKEMIKGYIESIILRLLEEEDLYGYEISKRIRTMSEENFEVKEGTLYVVLKRLENKELVTSYWDEGASGGGRRRNYRITDSGREYLLRKQEEWSFFKRIIDIFLGGGRPCKELRRT